MYPSSLSRRAISSLIREFGISTWSWSARFALRMRLSMSAIGSVNIGFSSISRAKRSGQTSSMENAKHFSSSLPGTLGHAGDRAFVRELAQADPAEAELAIDRARAAAAAAARVVPHLELLRARGFDDEGFFGHYSSSPSGAGSAMPGKGMPRPRSRASACSLSAAVVVIATSR